MECLVTCGDDSSELGIGTPRKFWLEVHKTIHISQNGADPLLL